MKENPSPGPSIQRVFSAKRSVALLLALTFALCITLLVAPVGKAVHAASVAASPTALPTPTQGTPTPPRLNVTITSPSNGSVYTLPTPIPVTVQVSGMINSTTTADFNVTLEPNGPTTTQGFSGSQQGSPDTFTTTWVPPQAGTYSLVAAAEAISNDNAGNATGSSTPITVQVNGPQGSPTPQVSPSPQLSPTTPLSGACQVSYQLESQWAGGFNANVVLTNTSPVSVNGWTLAFTFPGDQHITQLWNGSYTQTGEQVTVTNLSYNSAIAPGGSVTFGSNGTWVSNNTSPTVFILNGTTCRAM